MNYKVTLIDELRDLVNDLTAKQKENWRNLIKFMRDKDAPYDHSRFSSEGYHNNCTLSYAISAGIIEQHENDDHFSAYEDAADVAFGQGASEWIFSTGSYAELELEEDNAHDFTDFCYHAMNIHNLENTTSSRVADALETLFGLTPAYNISNVTIHWKSNQKDKFKSVESLKEYLDLNPHRKNGYRKITVTKLVERTVYDEVTETIEL